MSLMNIGRDRARFINLSLVSVIYQHDDWWYVNINGTSLRVTDEEAAAIIDILGRELPNTPQSVVAQAKAVSEQKQGGIQGPRKKVSPVPPPATLLAETKE